MKNLSFIFLLLFIASACSSDIRDRKTTVEILDNEQVYYPILRGQELDVVFYINNTGEHPLLISDIITSCGCLVLSDGSNLNYVPSGRQGVLRMMYDSTKNVGEARHYVTLYGNFLEGDFKELVFEVNVVPNAIYTRDYEEIHFQEAGGGLKTFSDGDLNHKGYYLQEEF